MPLNSKETATISTLLLVIFLESLFACNTKQDDANSKSLFVSEADSLQIKELTDKYRQGKVTFQIKCAACHDAPEKHVTDQYIFDNLFDRMPKPSEDYFIKFIKNSKDLKASGDSYALKLAELWNNDYDHALQDTLSNQDLGN
jgi:hypothetical protein